MATSGNSSTESKATSPIMLPKRSDLVPSLGPYNPDTSWESYRERLELWFEINDVTSDKKMRGFLLTEIGAEVYETVKGLVMPQKVQQLSYCELVEKIAGHFGPQRNVILERYNFMQRTQKPGETMTQFIAEICKLSQFCNFAELENMLRDRIVCGVLSDSLRKKLLSEKDLTYKRACELARAEETAVKGLEEMKFEPASSTSEAQIVAKIVRKICFRCNKQHESAECWAKDKTCHKCKKTGHIAPACPNKGKSQKKVQAVLVKEDSQESDGEVASINVIGTSNRSLELEIDGKTVYMDVDSGASNTVMCLEQWKKLKSPQKLKQTDLKLQTWLKRGVDIVGQATVTVKVGDRVVNLPLIITKSGGNSLLGRNWFQPLGIYVHVPKINALESNAVESVLTKYHRIFRDELGAHSGRTVEIQLIEGVQPVFLKHRQVPIPRREAVEQELDKLVEQGVLEPVEFSEWATPICAVKKPDGSVRICGDYRATINPVTKTNAYPLPTVPELLAGASGQIFSKIDLTQAYQQLRVDDKTAELLTINTHKGLFRVKRMPFGISAAPGIFQRFMETLLAGIPGTQVFLDDILIVGGNVQEHGERLDRVLQKLDGANLTVKKEKCRFGVREVEFVGFRISDRGIQPTNRHVKDILEAPSPKNQTELRAFLGMINFYGRFVRDRASVSECLHRLLDGKSTWKWEEEHQQAIDKLKNQLMSAQILMHYKMDLPLILCCDSSPYGVGAVLAHVTPEGERPIAYFSRTLNQHQRNYAQIDKEALSIVTAVKNFHQYICGRKIKIFTDHRPLLGIFNPKKPIQNTISPRMTRWCLALGAYDYEIEYRPGEKHQNADALSRVPVREELEIDEDPSGEILMLQDDVTPVSAREIQEFTKKDATLIRVKRWILEGWPERCPSVEMKPFFAIRTELSLMKDVILKGNQVIVPEPLRDRLLNSLHATHWGMVNMKAIARSYMWWPGMDAGIETKVKLCERCQVVRNNPPKAPLCRETEVTKPWERLHLDFAGPVRGRIYLIVVDAMSKWLEVKVVKSQSSQEVVRVLRELFATHGVPAEIYTDNGTAFVSQEMKRFHEVNGIRGITISPWHPASNGQAEIMVQKTKKALLKFEGEDVGLKLARYLFAQHTTPSNTTGKTPCELLMGRTLKSCLSRLHPEEIKEEKKEKKEPRRFKVGAAVYVRNYAEGNRWVPAWVVEVNGPVSYKVQLEDGSVLRRHVNQMISRLIKDTQMPVEVHGPSELEESADVVESSGEEEDEEEEFESASEGTEEEVPAGAQEEQRPQRVRRLPGYLRDYVLS
ncbi:uncharacterized protein K02A2.6-like [Phlebotomus papatasi]|uniref:uncharacterized protein K02A2.6-like n=1 Tax=Phlebotomus papatasi TaxID=29031 RepID=UPI0024836EE5|nr:uncharacterized protein K02A2.6-like [Phlebotomus papatasi]